MSTHALLLDELSGFNKDEGNTKLTVDVILESNQQLNAIGEYELDLQKKGIKTIENLGGTCDQFDSIDLSDLSRFDQIDNELNLNRFDSNQFDSNETINSIDSGRSKSIRIDLNRLNFSTSR